MNLHLDAYEHGHFGDTLACPELASLYLVADPSIVRLGMRGFS